MVIFNPISVCKKCLNANILNENKSKVALERIILAKFRLQIESDCLKIIVTFMIATFAMYDYFLIVEESCIF